MALDDVLWLENAGAVYNAVEYRHLMQALLGAAANGVLSPLDLKVTQRGAGANMSVDIAVGNAAILGTEAWPSQGVYIAHSDAVTNLAIGASNATNPRYDLIVLRVRDSVYSGGTDSVALEVVAGGYGGGGTPTEPATPANSLQLARVLVPAGSGSVVNANIAERRTLVGPENTPIGRIGYKTLGSATGPGIAGTTIDVNGSSITRTIRNGGTVEFQAAIRLHSNVAGDVFTLQVQRDGTNIGTQFDVPLPIANFGQTVLIAVQDSPGGGSHTYKVRAGRGVGTGSGTVDSAGWVYLEDTGADVA